MSASPESLSELKARLDIHDVLARYCRGADRCDAALMRSCFHEDAWDDHGFFKGPAWDFAAQAAVNLRERFISSKHFMTNEYVELRGDTAASETYIFALMRRQDGDTLSDVTISARYLDRFEQRNREWKIVHRLLVNDGVRVDPVLGDDERMSQGQAGGRGAADPAHRLFRPTI